VHDALYRKAFDVLGIAYSVADASDASRKGLFSAARQIMAG
jgi:2-keto-3-deoxy-galactonokinase